MVIKKTCLSAAVFMGCLAITLNCYGQAFPFPGQTLQINTHLQSILGQPEWVLIVRDPQSQRVLPYLFDFRQNDNSWVAFTTARSYLVTESKLTWGPYAKISNFCHLENHIITGQSMFISLQGTLSPNPKDYKCSVEKYNDMPFPFEHQQN